MATYLEDPPPPERRPVSSPASRSTVLGRAQWLPRKTSNSKLGTRCDASAKTRYVRSKSPELRTASLACPLRRNILTKSEFEFCRQNLKHVFQRCSDMEFLRLSSLLSCLLHCFRPLHQYEVLSVFGFLFDRTTEGDEHGKNFCEEALEWLKLKCRELIFVDTIGYVRFAHPLFRQFLLSCPVQGVDRTHSTLAKACLMQLEVDGTSYLHGPHSSVPECAPFQEYASRFWQDHYRFVQRSSPGLTARVNRVLQKWLSEQTMSDANANANQSIEDPAQTCQAGLTICESLGFDVLAHAYSQLLEARQRISAPHLIDPRDAAAQEIAAMGQTLDSLRLKRDESTDSDSSTDEWVVL